MPEDNFGYQNLFAAQSSDIPTDEQLDVLAEFMARNVLQEDSKIPSGYTYFGQFITHDMSLESDFDGKSFPSNPILAKTIKNKRTPLLDLETIYGDTPVQPNEELRQGFLQPGSHSLLNLGWTTKGFVGGEFQNDLPRISGSSLANITDRRNDENLVIAQTSVAFIKFHNAVAEHLVGGNDTVERFEKARLITVRHYQWIVLHDFLRRVLNQSVLDDVLRNGNQYYKPDRSAVLIPLEFSVAAFRFGHSMVRDEYQWNKFINHDNDPTFRGTLDNLTLFTGDMKLGMGPQSAKFRPHLPTDWLINWNHFYDIDDSSGGERFNFAKKIDTKMSMPLGFLGSSHHYKRENSLPAIDLYRGRAFNLASGQFISNQIQPAQKLTKEQIAGLLPVEFKKELAENTPLFFYLLAESEIYENGESLGEIGSRIVAETVAGLLRLDEFSILNNEFSPAPELVSEQRNFGMPEMLKFIAQSNNVWDELDPIKDSSVDI